MNVLVVDDSDIIRRMIMKTLSLSELPVGRTFEAGNGREALEVLSEHWIDVVIADLNMPVMDGMDLLREMRNSNELDSTPVIVVSTEGASTRLAMLDDLGVATFVRKPFTPEQIRDAVRSLAMVADGGERNALVTHLGVTVMERFAMLFAEPLEPKPDSPGSQLLSCSLRFSGVVNGVLVTIAPVGLCEQMARAALGTEEPIAEPEAADALGEFTNMLAGMLGTTIDPDLHTDLTPPIVVRAEPSDWDRLSGEPFSAALDVEGMPMLLNLHMRRTR